MVIYTFNKSHIEEAKKLALLNYNEERDVVRELPEIDDIPNLECFAENKLGVTAFEDGKMLGFLSFYRPWKGAFGSLATATFSPVFAHGAVLENRGKIIKMLYQAAARKLIENGITYHTIAFYAHDRISIEAMFSYGFGLRCVDAIRPMETFPYKTNNGVTFNEISKEEEISIRPLRFMLSNHLSDSPCFLENNFDNWINRAETRDSRTFVAYDGKKTIAFIEITQDGENFLTAVEGMLNICGSFCLPEYRGQDIFQGLLNHTIEVLKSEGYKTLGVDYESLNPTASGFWKKYFTIYTNSLMRRIDECALHKAKQ